VTTEVGRAKATGAIRARMERNFMAAVVTAVREAGKAEKRLRVLERRTELAGLATPTYTRTWSSLMLLLAAVASEPSLLDPC
jgi:hypothetical protein